MTAALITLLLGTGMMGVGLLVALPKPQPLRVAAKRK